METGRTGACGRTRLQEQVDNEDRSGRAQGKQAEKLGVVKQNRKNAKTTGNFLQSFESLIKFFFWLSCTTQPSGSISEIPSGRVQQSTQGVRKTSTASRWIAQAERTTPPEPGADKPHRYRYALRLVVILILHFFA